MKETVHSSCIRENGFNFGSTLSILLAFLLTASFAKAENADFFSIQPLPDITISCDFTFPFNPNSPNDYVNDFDNIFGKLRVGTTSGRDSINIYDRVCPSHPRFNEFAPSNPFADPCYDDSYRIFWGYDGYALGYGNLPLEQTIVPNLHCSRGSIIREWRQYNSSAVITSQTIYIIDCKEFYVPTNCWRFTPADVGSCDLISSGGTTQYLSKLVEWPCDVEITTCQQQNSNIFLPENLPVSSEQDRRPRLDDDRCSLLAASYTDQTFPAVDSVCVKVFRTWKIIDWCLYEDYINGQYSGPYEWTRTQVIKMTNFDGPDFANCADQTFCGYGDPNSTNDCTGLIELRPQITDDCTLPEDLRIDFKLDLDDDGDYDLLGYSENQGNVYPFPNPNNLPVQRFDASAPHADGLYPVGTHRILWGAEDGCGNSNVCVYRFTIEDCKPPTAYCEIGVSTIPMPLIDSLDPSTGFVEIWASDFDLGSTDNCTAQADLIFSFSADPTDRSRRFTCADAGQQLNYTIYVWDEEGNYSTCLVSIILNNCDNNFNFSMNFANEDGEQISSVQLKVRNDSGEETTLTSPTNNGIFNFNTVNFPGPYTIRPYKNINPLNGVTTYDMVLIAKHILNVQPLSSPYKMIAADINRSNSISTFDMIGMRKVILYITTEFDNNTSWRFVDANYDFIDPTNPFIEAFPEEITINDLADTSGLSFVGIKIADVNCSADINNFTSGDTEDRNGNQPLLLRTEDQPLKAGNSYTVQFTADEMEAALGFQFTLGFDTKAITVEAVETAVLAGWGNENLGLSMLDRGLIMASWNQAKAAELNGQALFNVNFRALKDGLLSDVFQLNADYLAAEAYSDGANASDIGIHDVALQFTSAKPQAGQAFELQANRPNPFRKQTTIGFTLPQAGAASLKVYDALGRLVFEKAAVYSEGYHELELNNSDLQGAGLYYYSLESNGELAGKNMILID